MEKQGVSTQRTFHRGLEVVENGKTQITSEKGYLIVSENYGKDAEKKDGI